MMAKEINAMVYAMRKNQIKKEKAIMAGISLHMISNLVDRRAHPKEKMDDPYTDAASAPVDSHRIHRMESQMTSKMTHEVIAPVLDMSIISMAGSDTKVKTAVAMANALK